MSNADSASSFGQPVLDWETVCCEICKSESAEPVFTGRDRLLGLSGEFHVVRCKACGLLYTNPRPAADSLRSYYPPEYGVFQPSSGQSVRLQLYHSRIAAMLDRLWRSGESVEGGAKPTPAPDSGTSKASWIPGSARLTAGSSRPQIAAVPPQDGGRAGPPQLLDIGCGDGTFAAEMRSLGWQVVGLEMDESTARRARSERGLEIVHAPVEQAQFESGRFDLVTMSHLLEHVPQPRLTLARAREWLAPGGFLFMTMPNQQCFERLIFGTDWYPWDLPRHLFHFSPMLLRRMLDEEGFRWVTGSYLVGFYAPQSAAYWLRSRRSAETALDKAGPETTQQTVEASVFAVPDRWKTVAYAGLLRLSALLGRRMMGEIMEVVAQKPA